MPVEALTDTNAQEGRGEERMSRNEPENLRRGKEFHREVQRDWMENARDGNILPEETILLGLLGRRRAAKGRIDILVDEITGDEKKFVSVVEVKSTDWDRIKPENVTKNLGSHRRQVWKYIDKFIEVDKVDICPGIIYPDSPKTPGLRERIETYLNDYGIQVVWLRDDQVRECQRQQPEQGSERSYLTDGQVELGSPVRSGA